MLLKSHVKYIQSLGQKKFRDAEAVFVAEGPKLINELLQADNMVLVKILGVKEWLVGNPRIHEKLTISDIIEINKNELERISFLSSPNQVLGLFKKPRFPVLPWKGSVSLVLDGIQDPGNLGTIVRTADWFAIQNIICSLDSADVFNPKAIQSTMGSICRVQVVYEDLPKILTSHPALPVYGAVLEGKSVMESPRITEGLILIGSESKGIRPELLARVNFPVTIPRRGGAESLNAAVATGIILSHLL